MTGVNMREITEAGLALLVVGGVVAIAVFDGINGKPVNIPPELYGFGGIIIGAYFRGSNQINGVAAKLVTALKESSPPSQVTIPTSPTGQPIVIESTSDKRG